VDRPHDGKGLPPHSDMPGHPRRGGVQPGRRPVGRAVARHVRRPSHTHALAQSGGCAHGLIDDQWTVLVCWVLCKRDAVDCFSATTHTTTMTWKLCLGPLPGGTAQNFREPLYLSDKPVVYEDDRTEEEKEFPELFRHRLRGARQQRTTSLTCACSLPFPHFVKAVLSDPPSCQMNGLLERTYGVAERMLLFLRVDGCSRGQKNMHCKIFSDSILCCTTLCGCQQTNMALPVSALCAGECHPFYKMFQVAALCWGAMQWGAGTCPRLSTRCQFPATTCPRMQTTARSESQARYFMQRATTTLGYIAWQEQCLQLQQHLTAQKPLWQRACSIAHSSRPRPQLVASAIALGKQTCLDAHLHAFF
jgi:hypothetical protein